MSYDIEIMPAEEADLDTIGQLIFDSIHTLGHSHYSKEQIHAWAPHPYAGEDAKIRFANHLFFIAQNDVGIAAIMSLTPEAHLDIAFSHPAHAGKGAASQSYAALETYARAQGVKTITSDISLIARPFFEKRGYEILKQQAPIRNGTVLTNFSAQKILS